MGRDSDPTLAITGLRIRMTTDKKLYAQAAGIRAQRTGRARDMKAVDNRKPLWLMRLRRRRTSACRVALLRRQILPRAMHHPSAFPDTPPNAEPAKGFYPD